MVLSSFVGFQDFYVQSGDDLGVIIFLSLSASFLLTVSFGDSVILQMLPNLCYCIEVFVIRGDVSSAGGGKEA